MTQPVLVADPQVTPSTLLTHSPLPHRLFTRISFIHPATSKLALGLVRTPPDYLPDELPTLMRKRLIAYLLGKSPLPHLSLWRLLPPGEAKQARLAFRRLLRLGLSVGEALYELGILIRKDWCNVPLWCEAEILASGCSCDGLAAGKRVLISSSAGTVIDNAHRVLHCSETLATLPASRPA